VSRPIGDPPPPELVVDTFVRVAFGYRRRVSARLAELGLPDGLSGPRVRVLLAVADAAPVRMSDLAGQVGISPRTITTLVDGLEEAGLVARRPEPGDRRAMRVDLTETGRGWISQIRVALRALADEVLGDLNPTERGQLLQLLSRVRADGSDCDPEGC
jgi:DNA-binding MarR family transcriptional regulator